MFWVLILVLFLLSLTGLTVFIRQKRYGLAITQLRDDFSWGLYIQLFLYMSSIASGIIIFDGIIVLLEIRELYAAARIGSMASLSCLICAGLMIGADVGKPFRFTKLVSGKRFNSPLAWDFCLLAICIFLNLVFMLDMAIQKKIIQVIWAILSISAASLYVMVHTLFFVARADAGSQLQQFIGIKTITHCVSAGVALIILIALGIEADLYDIPKVVIISTCLTLASLIAELIGLNKEKKESVHICLTAIVIHTFILALLLMIFITHRYETIFLALSSILILFYVFQEKSHILKFNQQRPVLPLPYSQFDQNVDYHPSKHEYLLSIGVVSFCALLIATMINFLQL